MKQKCDFCGVGGAHLPVSLPHGAEEWHDAPAVGLSHSGTLLQ